MALIFQTPIVTQEGITIENAYGRVTATDIYNGSEVQAFVNVFVSESAFLNGMTPISKVPFQAGAMKKYNREKDGTDILAIGHDALVEVLGSQGYVAIKSLS